MKKEVESEVKRVLDTCIIEGNNVKLPDEQLDRTIYMGVKKALELIGGKWKGGKVQAFVFPTNPSDLLGRVQGGEKVNLKKEYQFFATPEKLADKLVQMAKVIEGQLILEPSAGQGAIIDAILRWETDVDIHYHELMEVNQDILKDKYADLEGVSFICPDFLEKASRRLSKGAFDRIIANPPFTKNQDIDHILEMYNQLKPFGRMVSMASKHWVNSTNSKETEFRVWLHSVGAEIEEVPAGAFKESGTNIETVIITINKKR